MNYNILLDKLHYFTLRHDLKKLFKINEKFEIKLEKFKKYQKEYFIGCNHYINKYVTLLEYLCILKSYKFIIYLIEYHFYLYKSYDNIIFVNKQNKTLLHLLFINNINCDDFYDQMQVINLLIKIKNISYLFYLDNDCESAFEYLFKYRNNIATIKLIIYNYNIYINLAFYKKYYLIINYINNYNYRDYFINNIKICYYTEFNENKFYNNFFIASNAISTNKYIRI